MKQAHPYEEVGYDVFRLENDGPMRGIGRVGQLKAPVTLEQFLAFTGQQLQCDHLTYQGDLQKSVQRVALCGGSGISYLKAAKKAGADVYVTGDMKYHDGQLAGELGVSVVDAGHFGTERLITQPWQNLSVSRVQRRWSLRNRIICITGCGLVKIPYYCVV